MSRKTIGAYLLQPDQFLEISRAFCRFDRDDNGYIEAHELQASMENVGLRPTPAQVLELLDSVDVDRNGKVEFEEYVLIMSKRMLEEDSKIELDLMLKLLSSESGKEGMCSVSCLCKLMTSAGNPFNESEFSAFLAAAGPADEQGLIPISRIRIMEFMQPPQLPTHMMTRKSVASMRDLCMRESVRTMEEEHVESSTAGLATKSRIGPTEAESQLPTTQLPTPGHRPAPDFSAHCSAPGTLVASRVAPERDKIEC